MKIAKAKNRSLMGNLEKVVKLIKNKCWGNKSQEEYLEKITRIKNKRIFIIKRGSSY